MESDLCDAFYGEIKAYGATENLPVSYPNVDFDPPKENDMYLAAWILPTRPEVMTICNGASQHIKVLQVSVYARKGTGEQKSKEQADKLAIAFPVTHKFISGGHEFTVITPPTPNPSVGLNGWNLLPVQFRASIIN